MVIRGRLAPWVRERAVWLALGAVVLVYVTTRLALVWRFPVFSDEAAYAGWAQRVHDSASDRFVSLANGKEPLLPWLGAVLIWLRVGAITSLRLISVLSGLVSLSVAVLLARRLGGAWAGVVAAAVYALLPLFVVHDVLGLMEPLLTATVMLSLYLTVRLAERPRLDLAIILGLALGAGVLTKASGQLTVVLVGTGLVLLPWRSPEIRSRLSRFVGCIALALLLCGVIHAVLKLSPLYYEQAQIQKSAVAVRGFDAAFAHPLRWFDENWPGYQAALRGYLTIPIALVAVAGLVYGILARARLAIVIALWSLTALVADVLFGEAGYARYLLPAIAPLPALVAHGALQLARSARRVVPPSRYALMAAAGVVLLVVAAPLYLTASVLAGPATARYPGLDDAQFVTGWTAGHPWTGAARELRLRAGGQKALVELGDLSSGVLTFDLMSDPNLTFARYDQLGSQHARFAVENGVPLPSDSGPGQLRVVWQEQRPRHGVTLRLYERGIVVEGRFVTTADGLRSLIGGGDGAFDTYTRAHPAVRAWYEWFEAQIH